MRTGTGGGRHFPCRRARNPRTAAPPHEPTNGRSFRGFPGDAGLFPAQPVTAPADRQPLRAALRARRAALSAAERIAASQGLVEQLEGIPEFLTDRRIAGYWAVDGELPLAAVMAGVRERGQSWFLPVLGPERQLRFGPWHARDAIRPNRYGIPEPVCPDEALLMPAEIDVVLLPLLGFDRTGERLGFGGGWYDRSFAFTRGRAAGERPLLVGIGYAVQEVPLIEPQPWDVRLDYIATERELIDLTGDP